MEKFFTYHKEANGTPVFTISDFIPTGRENAIGRKVLTQLCVAHGLIDFNIKDKDRAMRALIQKNRHDFVILNLSNGDGYYRPSLDDVQDLQRYIRQEEKRAKSSFKNITLAKAMYEDLIHERFEGK